jgi:hypothetical protein
MADYYYTKIWEVYDEAGARVPIIFLLKKHALEWIAENGNDLYTFTKVSMNGK